MDILAAAAPAPTIAPTVERFVEPTTKGDLSPAEAATMAGWIKADLAARKLTPEQANKAWDELGATPEQRTPDSRTEEAKQAEAQFGPVGAAEKYRFEWYLPGDPTPVSPADKAVESLARRALVEMGFPQPNGQSLLNTVARVMRERQGWTAEQREAATLAADQKIETLYGHTFDARLAPAKRMLDEVDQKVPGIKAFLWDNGIIGHADVMNALVMQSRVYDARKGR